jgi:hypothetical protein
MNHKLSQSLIFFTAGATLFIGGMGTYHLVFKEKDRLPHLISVSATSSIPSGSLLQGTPYSIDSTREAENRVRTRSPAFQSESTQLEVKAKRR